MRQQHTPQNPKQVYGPQLPPTYQQPYGPQLPHNHRSYALSPAPQKAAEEMISLISQLQDVYQRETQALEASDVKGFMRVQNEKMSTARKYEFGMAQMLERREEMKSLDDKIKTTLRDMQKAFSELVSTNLKALERMQRSTTHLVDILRSETKKAVEKNTATGYGQDGALNSRSPRNMSVGIAETA